MGGSRIASHAGSWYPGSTSELRPQLKSWMEAAPPAPAGAGRIRMLVAPHAGYRYCGPTAGSSYAPLAQCSGIKRVVVLGPSHVEHIESAAVTTYDAFQTPLGELHVDTEAIARLRSSKLYAKLDVESDDAEHSLEMQMPFVAQCAPGATVVPVIVGGPCTISHAEHIGETLAPFLLDEGTAIAVSSDFCHWGRRFGYTRGADDPTREPADYIAELDARGARAAAALDAPAFESYIAETRNTICGRNAILAAVCAVRRAWGTASALTGEVAAYAQSSRARTAADSSVSYASIRFFGKGE
eukprot:m51a1_g2506 hypothetical protein (299) ;mRNA; r:139734-140857